jgi:hypothetical protein
MRRRKTLLSGGGRNGSRIASRSEYQGGYLQTKFNSVRGGIKALLRAFSDVFERLWQFCN